jgi:chemotaxis protein MotB
MLDTKEQADPDDAPGAPEWMVTFSDCMTLLLTFFVLLLSFSSFDERIFRNLRLVFAKALPSTRRTVEKQKSAFIATEQIEATEEVGKGSEKPTLAKGRDDNLKEETEPVDFQSRKVFLIPSKKIFWGKGTVISSEGRDIMATMASFLRKMPARIIVSENGWADENNSEQFGLPRAWAVLEHLITKQGLDKNCFSISASSTAIQRNKLGRAEVDVERMLEIVLLERSIYN